MTRNRRIIRRQQCDKRSADSILSSVVPAHWFRADTVTLSSGNTSTMANRGSDGGQMAVSVGTIPAPAVDATLNNRPSIALTGTMRLTSSLAASSFKYLHDGTGCSTFCVFVPTSDAVSASLIWGTRTSGTGVSHYRGNAGGGSFGFFMTGGPSVSLTSALLAINTAVYTEARYLESASPEYNLLARTTSLGTGSVVPNTGDPENTLMLGAQAANPTAVRLADFISFNRVLAADERVAVAEYIRLRYGV